jgi:hypothetical protein
LWQGEWIIMAKDDRNLISSNSRFRSFLNLIIWWCLFFKSILANYLTFPIRYLTKMDHIMYYIFDSLLILIWWFVLSSHSQWFNTTFAVFLNSYFEMIHLYSFGFSVKLNTIPRKCPKKLGPKQCTQMGHINLLSDSDDFTIN